MSAAMIGADPDQLDQLAGSFERQAQALDAAAQRVRAQIHGSSWRGGAASRFRQDWDSTHMPRLKQTSASLRSVASNLRRQANDQRRASGIAGATSGAGRVGQWSTSGTNGSSGGGVTPVPWGQDWKAFEDSTQGQWFFGSLGAAGAMATLGANSSLVGRYAGGTPRAFFQYKASLNGIFSVNGLGEKVNNIRGLGTFGRVLGVVGVAANVQSFMAAPSHLGAMSVVASSLKTSTHPVAYLGGVALSSVHMAAEAAGEADFSEAGRLQVTDYLGSQGVVGGAKIVAEEAGRAAVEVLTKRIWSIF